MSKKGIVLCLVVFLACIDMVGCSKDKFSVSEKLIAQIDSSSWIPETLKVSPDSRRVAYIAQQAAYEPFVVMDGKEEKQYNDIKDVIFSPDSKRVAYMARVHLKWFVVVDEKEERKYDGIGEGYPIFSPDSKRVAYGAKVGESGL